MDRIDLRVQVEPLSRVELSQSEGGESSESIAIRVTKARVLATSRFANEEWSLNSEIPGRALRTTYRGERDALNFLHAELDQERLSARGFHKVMRIAWSIADLAMHERPTLEDTKKAYELRQPPNGDAL
ncbi:MAG: hypothetical protein WDO06_03735 [Actinomycetota bacterium]